MTTVNKMGSLIEKPTVSTTDLWMMSGSMPVKIEKVCHHSAIQARVIAALYSIDIEKK